MKAASLGHSQGVSRAEFLPEAPGEKPFPCLFQLLEHSLHSLAHGSSLHPQSQ